MRMFFAAVSSSEKLETALLSISGVWVKWIYCVSIPLKYCVSTKKNSILIWKDIQLKRENKLQNKKILFEFFKKRADSILIYA